MLYRPNSFKFDRCGGPEIEAAGSRRQSLYLGPSFAAFKNDWSNISTPCNAVMSFPRTTLFLPFCEHDGKPLIRLPRRLHRRHRYPLEEKSRKRGWIRQPWGWEGEREGCSWILWWGGQGGDFDRDNIHHACRDSSVGIATGYGLDGPGIEPRWGDEIFRTRPDQPWGPPSLVCNGYRAFPGGKAAGA